MIKERVQRVMVSVLGAAAVIIVATPGNVGAHCDAENGPVAVAAREALESGSFDTIAIWVGQDQEDELKSGFEVALPVYKMGGTAKDLARRYFVESSVRLHRLAEGMSYTGLKPKQPLPPDISKAEEALETGDLENLMDFLSNEMREEIQKWHQQAYAAEKNFKRSGTVDAGRDWVDAYVKYVIYVHGIHEKIQAGPEHGVGHIE